MSAKRYPPNVAGFREVARRKLPRQVFEFVDGGSGDETTVEANLASLRDVHFAPRVLVGATGIDLSSTLCGRRLDLPILLSPTGLAGLVHPSGEMAAAVVAAKHGTVSLLSNMSNYSMEELAAAVTPPPWLQMYLMKDKDLTGVVLDRARAAGMPGICLTVDTPVSSRRDRDLANGWTKPPRLVGRNSIEFIRRPGWLGGVLKHRRVVVQNAGRPVPRPSLVRVITASTASVDSASRSVDPTQSWDALSWLRENWTGPIMVKGVLVADDARRAVDLGADAILVSNHGGRQLDGARSSFSALPEIVEAVGSSVDVVLDGGIRRGTDVIKAMCMGASACAIGRPWLWGIAAGGESGLDALLTVLRQEMEIGLRLLGQPCARQLDRSYLA